MSQATQYWQYAEEAMLSAQQSKSEMEKAGLMDLARAWTQAAMQSETEPKMIVRPRNVDPAITATARR